MCFSAKFHKMKIQDIHNYTSKPNLYEKGNAVMWTDEHISRQLLAVHLNTEVDLASRRKATIDSTVDWILAHAQQKQLNILDLGCAPGLYTEKLAQKGHKVTGVDFSANSIAYAKKEAQKKNLDITYLQENYLQLDLGENTFDLLILIFTDFGALLPNEREQLLANIQKVLKPGGVFIFDVLNDKNMKAKISERNWETSRGGFWKNEPYIALSNSFVYEQNKVILYQHIVLDEQEDLSVYRFWTHFFSHQDLTDILHPHDFDNLTFYVDVLPEGDLWNGNNVTFCKAVIPNVRKNLL